MSRLDNRIKKIDNGINKIYNGIKIGNGLIRIDNGEIINPVRIMYNTNKKIIEKLINTFGIKIPDKQKKDFKNWAYEIGYLGDRHFYAQCGYLTCQYNAIKVMLESFPYNLNHSNIQRLFQIKEFLPCSYRNKTDEDYDFFNNELVYNTLEDNTELYDIICEIEKLHPIVTKRLKKENDEILNFLIMKVKERYIAMDILSITGDYYYKEILRIEMDKERLK